MSDKRFEYTVIALSLVVLLWMVLGSILLNNVAIPVITGIIIWICIGAALLFAWGKSYMNKL